MNEDTGIRHLSDYSEIRQTIAARPPKLLRGSVVVVLALLVAGVIWAALTKSDLTVSAVGRIRPVDEEGGETKITALVGGQVIEAAAHLGDKVKEGDLILRIDARKLDNEIEDKKQSILGARGEMKKLERLRELQAAEIKSARAKSKADLDREADRIRREEEKRLVEFRRARVVLKKAREEEIRIQTLVEQEAAPRTELEQAESSRQDAEYRLEKAGLKTGDANLDILRKAMDLVERQYAVKAEELEIRISQKLGAIRSAEKSLENLELDRGHAEVRAPINGMITQCGGHKGDLVSPGDTLFIISGEHGMQMEARVSSRDAGLIELGMETKIRLEAFDYQKYGTLAGTVVSISPDSQVIEGSVFYIIRIDLESEEIGSGAYRKKVKLGMVGSAEMVTGKETLLSIAFRKFRKKVDVK
jgi:multidrug resistance efflux pump